jgi:hypothetical protein
LSGLFYDRHGWRDWNATIIKIIDNPISIHQAFWSPCKKFVRFIGERMAKRAATAHEAATAKLQGAESTAGGGKAGTGWAINGRVRINMPLGAFLTDAKELPPGAKRLLNDPFSDEKKRRRSKRPTILVVVVLVLGGVVWWRFDWLKPTWDARRTPDAGDARPPPRPPNRWRKPLCDAAVPRGANASASDSPALASP